MGRNLLLCFDAFGTLFKPRRPVAEQYAAVARQCGLDGLAAEQLQASFKAAFSRESKAHPNYGKASGLNAEQWWTNVIRNTFQPLIGSGRELPRDLAPRLLRRFSSREGYSLAPGVDSLLRSLKQHKQQQQQQQRSCQIVVGVITNSDDRVPSILSSLGLRVSPVRFGSDLDPAEVVAGKQYDIDLHCMSYDVGFAKPDRRIFDAAEDMAKRIVATTRNDGGGGGEEDVPLLKLYVGDELEKDALGARAAGWNSVLVGPDGSTQPEGGFSELGRWGTLTDIFREGGTSPLMARVESTQMLLEWLIKEYQC